MNNSEEFLKFNELQTKFKKIIELFEEKKMLQKISYFSKKENKKYINWKSIEMLKKYITRFGNIKPRKYTKNSVLTQKALRTAILKAREI
jgi:small subunit ribosomal protein S18